MPLSEIIGNFLIISKDISTTLTAYRIYAIRNENVTNLFAAGFPPWRLSPLPRFIITVMFPSGAFDSQSSGSIPSLASLYLMDKNKHVPKHGDIASLVAMLATVLLIRTGARRRRCQKRSYGGLSIGKAPNQKIGRIQAGHRLSEAFFLPKSGINLFTS